MQPESGVVAEELAELEVFAQRLADAARGETLPRFRSGTRVFEKAGPIFDPVTDADREAEHVLRAMIHEAYPDHGVLGEEHGVHHAEGPWRWVLDPVDGTRAFMCGMPTWATLIALEHDGVPVLGVIDQPYTGERWVGSAGRAVFRRGSGEERACRTSGVTALGEARISTTDPRPTAYFGPREADAFAHVAAGSRVARFSMDAYAYGLLAIGEIDLVMEAGLKRYDFAALIPIIEAAGGVITNWEGAPAGSDSRGETLAAATPALHEAALARLAELR
jgi:inositol-phosphate phosphatase/L-galactose 1-phosphate phosphatase/histidinol-phosphatase